MDAQRAINAFEASLQSESATPDFGADDREAFLIDQRNKLRSLAIPPRAVTAKPLEWAKSHGEFADSTYKMIAIAGENGHWLLYDPDTEMFSLANGTLDGELGLVGFRSTDALAEWCG